MREIPETIWQVSDPAPDDFFESLSSDTSESVVHSRLLGQLLWNRGLTATKEIQQFLLPDYERDTHDPYLLKNMDKAARIVEDAIRVGKKILVFSDYDADGVTGGAILSDFFTAVGAVFEVFIPDRFKDPYGLTLERVREFADRDIALLITVDCGVTSVDEIALARSLGIDVVVLDHHIVPPRLPDAYAIINHKQPGETYPEHTLSGAGLAYKLVQALVYGGRLPGEYMQGREKWLLDLVSISTVADMVALRGENRALVTFGLKVLKKAQRPGIVALLAAQRIAPVDVTEETIGFTIAPRINAASRMDHAYAALRLLTTRDDSHARELAHHLEGKNTERKTAVEDIMIELEERLRVDPPEGLIFEGSHAWSAGVVGLAASRLMERYQYPVFLYSLQHGFAKGSCRAPLGMNLVHFMKSVEDLFMGFGGHESAGGFTFEPASASGVKEQLQERAILARQSDIAPVLEVDAQITLEDISASVYADIRRLAPFGMENSKPRFLLRGVPLASTRAVGQQSRHLKLQFGRERIGGIFFGGGERTRFRAGTNVDVVAELQENTWNGKIAIELRVIDMKSSN